MTNNNHCDVLEIQMMIPKIIERISRYLGIDYISKIKIIGLKNKDSKDEDYKDGGEIYFLKIHLAKIKVLYPQ